MGIMDHDGGVHWALGARDMLAIRAGAGEADGMLGGGVGGEEKAIVAKKGEEGANQEGLDSGVGGGIGEHLWLMPHRLLRLQFLHLRQVASIVEVSVVSEIIWQRRKKGRGRMWKTLAMGPRVLARYKG
ncbi:hypothetical protein COCNU_scaffold010768G000020 [Cocos nucifera]|nr:hypothetical protein [Cocos nucifera]